MTIFNFKHDDKLREKLYFRHNFRFMETTPRCQYFGNCGGCSLQNIDYKKQIQDKVDFIRSVTGFDNVTPYFADEYNYRNRLDMAFTEGGLGFRKKGNWREAIHIAKCEIASDGVNSLIREVEEFFLNIDVFNPRKHSGTFHHALLRATTIDSAISIIVNKDSPQLSEARDKTVSFAKVCSAKNVAFTKISAHSGSTISDDFEMLKGKALISEKILEKQFFFPLQGFFQNNIRISTLMQKYVSEILEKHNTANAHLLDLYGGVGTFAAINSAKFNTVTLIESFPSSIDCAKLNFQTNDINNVNTISLDAKSLKTVDLPKPLFIITDPPRSGMHPKTIETLNTLAPELIIYVCCNPKMLKEDLPKLNSYKINSVAMFDMFPQTPHCEAVIELQKTGL